MHFTNVTSLRAEAQGEPGERTFRILASSGTSSAIMWLEKEQLFELELAIKLLLAALTEERGADQGHLDVMEATPMTHLEFKAGRLALGHDRTSGKFIIDAQDAESYDDAPAVRLWGDGSQVKAFGEEALRVCAAGRAICPLCGGPIDPTGHRCPRTNGHHRHDLAGL